MLVRIELDKNKNGSGSYSFSEDNYNAGKCGEGHNLTKSFTQGDPIFDAARRNMGEPWMIPTKDQLQELLDNSSHTWTSINGVTGRKFINKTDPPKYIFLPAGGCWYNMDYYRAGEFSYYWSSTIYISSTSRSWSLFFSSDTFYITDFNHVSGYSIRPVAPARPW